MTERETDVYFEIWDRSSLRVLSKAGRTVSLDCEVSERDTDDQGTVLLVWIPVFELLPDRP